MANTQNRNKLEVAKGNFANAMRSLNNREKVNAASKEYNFQMEQLSEELRSSMTGGFNSQIQLAVARGALAAQAGYVGVGGSSVDLMDTMVRLQGEMDLEAQQNATSLLASRGAQRTAQIMSNAYGSMDLSRSFGNFDYQEFIEPQHMKRRFGKLVGVAVATYFGGPQAGEAVADFAVGTWQAENGQFDSASQSFGDAAQNAVAAYQQWGQRGGKSWGSSVAEGFGWGNGGKNEPSITRVTYTGNNEKTGVNSKNLGWF